MNAFELKKEELLDRSRVLTQMIAELRAGEKIDFNLFIDLLVKGHMNELSYLCDSENEQAYRMRKIAEIDVLKFSNKD